MIRTFRSEVFHAMSRKVNDGFAKTLLLTKVLLVCIVAIAMTAQPVLAAVPTCDSLTMYGNAVNEGLCKSLSPGTQTNWVCELASSPDIHTTFNASNNLHLTVRDQSCDQNSFWDGTWPKNLKIQKNEPTTICGVSVQSYVDRFNAVKRVEVPNGSRETMCRQAFLTAERNGKITPSLMQSYLNLCGRNNCQ